MTDELSHIAALQLRIKQRSMTYQPSAKEIVAAHYGLTFEEVDLPFREWMTLRAKYEHETGRSL